MNLVIKDAFWQILGRIFSAIAGFFVIKLITPYLGPLRYGDYSTILKYFAIWSALADFGLYVVALRELGKIKNEKFEDNRRGLEITEDNNYLSQSFHHPSLSILYNKFVGTRFFLIFVVYTTALIVAYFLPAYTSNPFLIYGLPLGMLFSATFMAAGIIQIPLQLFRKMENLTKALILSRIVQIITLILIIFVFFKNVDFNHPNKTSIIAFELVLLSVLLSGLTQFFYVRRSGKKILPLKPIFEKNFILQTIKNNRKYGLAYYLSSFHTLVVLILLSIFFPTSKGFMYVGIWALALALIEILLIIPSALGNSLIHKISNLNIEEKKEKFGNLMLLVIWIGGVVFINFLIFSSNLIYFISGEKFLSNHLSSIGADFILPFLGIVLILSFIKQIFNYIFVSENLQNKLLYINLFGVTIGILIGLPFILKFNLIGGIITQLLLEILFVSGSILIAYKYGLLPKIKHRHLVYVLSTLSILGLIGKFLIKINYNDILSFLIIGLFLNIILLALSYKQIKVIAKNL